MKPTYTEMIDGRPVLALFDHRLEPEDGYGAGSASLTAALDGASASGAAAGASEPSQRGISVAYRSASFERSVQAITDALLKYLVINAYSTTNAAHEYMRDRVEMTVSAETDEIFHRANLSAGEVEHIFGMDNLATDFVRFERPS